MELKLNSKLRPLLVVAHPDDESIFFGGLLLRFKKLPWTVLCVTDGNAEGRGAERHQELLSACKKMGVKKILHWDFKDIYPTRLPVDELMRRLAEIENVNCVFTHGITGEYGHPHHQDVSYAVHRVFSQKKIPVWSAAYNSLGEKAVFLEAREFSLKCKILQEIYALETRRFLNILKSTQAEYFHLAAPKIIFDLYAWMTDTSLPLPKKLGPYEVLRPYLENRSYLKSAQGFFNNYFADPQI